HEAGNDATPHPAARDRGPARPLSSGRPLCGRTPQRGHGLVPRLHRAPGVSAGRRRLAGRGGPARRRLRALPRGARTAWRMHRTPADLAAHAALGITTDMLARAQVRRVDDFDARERLTSKHPGDLSGILYPYLSPTNGHATTYRLRRDHPEMEQGKPK